MRNRRGEITTILMLGTLVVIGVTAIISSLGGLNTKPKSTSTRASSCSMVDCATLGTPGTYSGKVCYGGTNFYSLGSTCGATGCSGSISSTGYKGGCTLSGGGGGTACEYTSKFKCETAHSSDKAGCISTGCSGITHKYVATSGGGTTCEYLNSRECRDDHINDTAGCTSTGCKSPRYKYIASSTLSPCTSSSNSSGKCTQQCEEKGSLRWICSGSGTTTPCNSSTYGTGCTSECKLSSTTSSAKYLCPDPPPSESSAFCCKYTSTCGTTGCPKSKQYVHVWPKSSSASTCGAMGAGITNCNETYTGGEQETCVASSSCGAYPTPGSTGKYKCCKVAVCGGGSGGCKTTEGSRESWVTWGGMYDSACTANGLQYCDDYIGISKESSGACFSCEEGGGAALKPTPVACASIHLTCASNTKYPNKAYEYWYKPGCTSGNCAGYSENSCNTTTRDKITTAKCGAVVTPPATDDCEKKFANCLEAYKLKYQGANKFSYYKSKSGTGANIYSSVDANNCTQSTWNEIANHYCKDTPLSEVSPVPGGNNPPDPEASPEPEAPQNLVPEKVDINELGSTQCEVKLPSGGNKIYSCDSSNTVRQEEKCTNGKWDGVKQATTSCAQWYSLAGKKCFFYYLTPQNGQVYRSQASYNSIEEALSASPCQITQGQTDSFSVEIRIPKEKNIQEANICLKDGGDYECKSTAQTGTEDGHTKVYSTQYTLETVAYNRLLKVYVIDANGNTYYGIPVEKTLLINSTEETPDYSFSINWN